MIHLKALTPNELAELRIGMTLRIEDLERTIRNAAEAGRVSPVAADLDDAKSALAKLHTL